MTQQRRRSRRRSRAVHHGVSRTDAHAWHHVRPRQLMSSRQRRLDTPEATAHFRSGVRLRAVSFSSLWPQLLAATRSDPASKQRCVCACGGVRLSVEARQQQPGLLLLLGASMHFSHRIGEARTKCGAACCVYLAYFPPRVPPRSACSGSAAACVSCVAGGVQQRALRARPLQAATAGRRV
jgi:hypothetical protein